MPDFKELTLADRQWVTEILKAENSPSADYTFGNMYMWVKKYPLLAAKFENRLLLRGCGEVPGYSFPVGSGPVRPALEAIFEYAAAFGEEFRMLGLTEQQRQAAEREYPGEFEFHENRPSADYIYSAEKLAAYSGHSLHGKRNHCNRFVAEYNWQFVPLTGELIPDCSDMLKEWSVENARRLDDSVQEEYTAIARCFDSYEALDLEGGVLIAGGKIMGFSVGEMACGNTFVVHYEKAVAESEGAYAMVCREMTRMAMKNHPGLIYINREDDMGIEHLRYSKMSYKPEFLLTKYDALRKPAFD